jgi:hypothetical protein
MDGACVAPVEAWGTIREPAQYFIPERRKKNVGKDRGFAHNVKGLATIFRLAQYYIQKK